MRSSSVVFPCILGQNFYELTTVSGKNNRITGLDRSWGFQEVEAPRFQDSRHMNVVSISALGNDRLYPPGNIPGTHFYQRLSKTQGHSAAGRIMSMKNSIDTIGNQTRDLPACSAVPQPTAPPRPSVDVSLIRIQSGPKKFIHSSLINIFGIN